MAKKKEVSVSIQVDGEGLVFVFPSLSDDMFMSEPEAFLAACFAVWVASGAGDDRAAAVRLTIESLASILLNEEEVEVVH